MDNGSEWNDLKDVSTQQKCTAGAVVVFVFDLPCENVQSRLIRMAALWFNVSQIRVQEYLPKDT